MSLAAQTWSVLRLPSPTACGRNVCRAAKGFAMPQRPLDGFEFDQFGLRMAEKRCVDGLPREL